MSDEVTLSVEGLQELYKEFNEIVKAVDPAKVEPILLDEAKVIQQAAINAAPKGKTGKLKKGIKVKQLDKIGNNPRSVIVKSTSPVDHIVEFGTKPRKQKNGRYTGSMPANPFFRPVVDQHKAKALNNVVNRIKSELDKV